MQLHESHTEFLQNHFPGRRFRRGLLGVRGSHNQSQKFGVNSQALVWRSFGVAQAFRNSVTLQQSRFIFPLFILSWGLTQQSKCANSEFWEAWTWPQLDFCPCWGWTLWDPSIPNLSLSVSSLCYGSKCLFWIPSIISNNYFEYLSSRLSILPGGILGLFSWRVEEENGTIVWDLFSPPSFWLHSHPGDRVNIDNEKSSLVLHELKKFSLESPGF